VGLMVRAAALDVSGSLFLAHISGSCGGSCCGSVFDPKRKADQGLGFGLVVIALPSSRNRAPLFRIRYLRHRLLFDT